MNRDDEDLLAAIRAGDDAAMGALLARHAPAIYRFGVKMCRDPEDAKDVLQETLLAAARGVREFRGASSLSTWLYTVARSFCIKKRRTSKFAPTNTVSLDDQAAAVQPRTLEKGPEEAASDRELTALLDRAVASLDPASREVLVLRDVDGLTAPEVAEVLGVSVDAVKSRLHRARRGPRPARSRVAAGRSLRPASGSGRMPRCRNAVLSLPGGRDRNRRLRRDAGACRRLHPVRGGLRVTQAHPRSLPLGAARRGSPRRTRARTQGSARLHRAGGEAMNNAPLGLSVSVLRLRGSSP